MFFTFRPPRTIPFTVARGIVTDSCITPSSIRVNRKYVAIPAVLKGIQRDIYHVFITHHDITFHGVGNNIAGLCIKTPYANK